MNILGLHFGHDAAAAIIRDGRIVNCIVRERLTRAKHNMSLDWPTIALALRDAGLSADDIDYAAVTSTQNLEIIAHDPDRIGLAYEMHPDHIAPAPFAEALAQAGDQIDRHLSGTFFDGIFDPLRQPLYASGRLGHYFPEHRSTRRDEYFHCGGIDRFVSADAWQGARPLDVVASVDGRAIVNSSGLRHGFHYPATLKLNGHSIPAYVIYHHLAHAASAYYPAQLDHAMILSHDGDSNGIGHQSGMIFYGRDHRIHPVTPHHLVIGSIYYLVGIRLGFGQVGGEGKLMGLAPYGNPAFFDPRFVGNWYDLPERGGRKVWDQWLDHLADGAVAAGYDFVPLGDRTKMTAPINADFAASTQRLFEETLLKTTAAATAIADGAGLPGDNLCLTGGAALNCPANSRLWRESRFERVVVPPWCDDSGLALGAALALWHNILDHPLTDAGEQMSAYLGHNIDEAEVERALSEAGDAVMIERPDRPWLKAAEDIDAGRIIAWYEGRSEIGPRALGHRSILADPRNRDNWARVNSVKGRETWRPFAPAVLAEKAGDWFDGCPLPSRHMLFTAQVKGGTLPAITHVDGSSRIQTVDRTTGNFRKVLEAFDTITGVPVVLNTSFNGPGEPIVETPAEALTFLLGSDLDVLYLDGRRVTRRL